MDEINKDGGELKVVKYNDVLYFASNKDDPNSPNQVWIMDHPIHYYP